MSGSIRSIVIVVFVPYLLEKIVTTGLINTSVSSIQTIYSLSGVDVGVIHAMLIAGMTIMFVVNSIFGDNVNKPKWIGISSIAIGIGGIVFAIPHFTAPAYQYRTSEFVNYCGNVTEPICKEGGLKQYMGVFIVGVMLIGGGSASILTYGITYIDDISSRRGSSVYVSGFFIMVPLGGLIGFVVGGAFTNLFVEPMRKVDIDSASPFWVGAWWPGYIIFGGLSLAVAIPILMLKPMLKLKKVKPRSAVRAETTKIEIFYELLHNGTYLLTIVVLALSYAFLFGFNSFGIKYVETQYNMTTFDASLAYASVVLFFGVAGHSTSAMIMAKRDLGINGLIKYCCMCAFLSAIFTFAFFIYCEGDEFAGGTVNYSTEDQTITTPQLNSSCNAHCGCTADWYNPVRGSDGVVYYSPCYAGCRVSSVENKTFTDCECILDGLSSGGIAAPLHSISDHFCKRAIGFAIIFGLAIYTSVLTLSPTTQITLRVVKEHQRSTAISIQNLIANVIGTIPGQITTGKVIDLACVAWSTKCGSLASCKVYKNWNMALYAFILLALETFLIFIVYLAMFFIQRSKKSSCSEVDARGTPRYPDVDMATTVVTVTQ